MRPVPATLPMGFQEAVVASGLTNPTAMEFSPDGRLFVAEQGGTMEVFQDGVRLFDALGIFNPRDVQQNLASPNFGRFFNGVPRDFQTFIEFSRW